MKKRTIRQASTRNLAIMRAGSWTKSDNAILEFHMVLFSRSDIRHSSFRLRHFRSSLACTAALSLDLYIHHQLSSRFRDVRLAFVAPHAAGQAFCRRIAASPARSSAMRCPITQQVWWGADTMAPLIAANWLAAVIPGLPQSAAPAATSPSRQESMSSKPHSLVHCRRSSPAAAPP